MTEKPQYYFEDVYRKIKDYGFCYKTWVKRRWIGKKILDMFVDEFKAFTPEYYVLLFICVACINISWTERSDH